VIKVFTKTVHHYGTRLQEALHVQWAKDAILGKMKAMQILVLKEKQRPALHAANWMSKPVHQVLNA